MKIQNLPRGLRNNNPANIRINYANNWKGMSDVQSDISFVQFVSIEYGIRALMKLLLNYHRKGYNTISSIISRFAPSSENDTQSYIDFVSGFFFSHGVVVFLDHPLNFTVSSSSSSVPFSLALIVRAICKMESNYDPSDSLLERAYSLL